MRLRERRPFFLVDGTAIYFRGREGRPNTQRLDYEGLNRILLAEAGAASFDPAIFFTTYDQQNDTQAKFLAFIQTRLGWEVEPRPVWDADPLPTASELGTRRAQPQFIRFDASMAYALGRLVQQRSHIIVVTDSFALQHPMLIAAEHTQTKIVLSFFGHQHF